MGCGCSKPEVPSPKVYRFGAIFSESGPYAFVGQPGAEVLRALSGSEVHGARLEFVVRDTHGNKAQALQEYRQMAQDPSILGVIGPSTTDETLALLAEANQAKLPCLSISAADRTQPKSPWVFRLPITTYHMVYQIGEYLAQHELRRLALVSVDSGFGQAGRRELLHQAEDFGLELVGDVVAPNRTLSDREADQLISKALASRPQALLIWWSASGAVELTLAARRQNISVPLLHSGGVASPDFIKGCGASAEGILFPGSPLLVPDWLGDDHRQKAPIDEFLQFCHRHRLTVSNFAGYGWDGAQLLGEAAVQAGAHRGKIRAYLENAQNRAAVSGVYHFTPQDHNGLTHDSFLMVEVRRGTWQPASGQVSTR